MNYDILVIGSGPGGYVAAIRAAQLGFKTAIVERENLGGICLNWGCIPTKALLKSAQVFSYIKNADKYGIHIDTAKPDFQKIITRSREVAKGMGNGVSSLMKMNKIEVIEGTAKLTANKQVEVEHNGTKKTVTAKHIILATGGRARQLPNLPIDGTKIIDYRKAMSLDTQPQSIVVVGAGAIGVEFAYFYNTIGTKVTIVEFADRLVPVEDTDISTELARMYKQQGIEVRTSTSVESVNTSGNGCVVTIKDAKTGTTQTISCDVVLSAVGVVSNIENIGLEAAGVKTDKGKVLVDPYCRTNVDGIYAIGDITPGQALAHVASAEGILCVETIAGLHTEPIDYNNIPGCTYCTPEIASVGYTEAAAKAAGYDLKIGKFPFAASGKASAAGAKEGFIKVIFDAKYGEFLGAHMIGSNVTEMIAEAVVARKLETTGHEILRAVHPHPTMSEAVMEATALAYGECIHYANKK
jgi:dihydrolipoamide dehydrogenase